MALRRTPQRLATSSAEPEVRPLLAGGFFLGKKRSIEAKMSSADSIQRKGLGSALLLAM